MNFAVYVQQNLSILSLQCWGDVQCSVIFINFNGIKLNPPSLPWQEPLQLDLEGHSALQQGFARRHIAPPVGGQINFGDQFASCFVPSPSPTWPRASGNPRVRLPAKSPLATLLPNTCQLPPYPLAKSRRNGCDLTAVASTLVAELKQCIVLFDALFNLFCWNTCHPWKNWTLQLKYKTWDMCLE